MKKFLMVSVLFALLFNLFFLASAQENETQDTSQAQPAAAQDASQPPPAAAQDTSQPPPPATAQPLKPFKQPAVPMPQVKPQVKPEKGVYYTRYSLMLEKNIYWSTNYRRGLFVPINTKVEFLKMNRKEIRVRLIGLQRVIRIINVRKYSLMDSRQLFSLMFSELPTDLSSYSEEVRQCIISGAVKLGMTKQEVLLTRGYPPAHQTPNLEYDRWNYWDNRWTSTEYRFNQANLLTGIGKTRETKTPEKLSNTPGRF